ncbi:MAG: hypothetical protein RL033_3750 [Pseudomonadota bacterium]|jgi:hypothetical protein
MASSDPELEVQLSAQALEVLKRAREQRREERAPDALRQRLLLRALEDKHPQDGRLHAGQLQSGQLQSGQLQSGQLQAGQPRIGVRSEHSSAVPATELVVVPQWTWRSTVQLLLAAACGVLLLFGARRVLWSWLDTGAPRPEAARGGSSAGERLLDTALFRTPAPTLPAGEAPSADANLFPEQPFSPRSGAWQVRRWDNLGVAPTVPAVHDFTEGALCIPLGAGERVLGGWPWAASDSVAPKGVPLAPGRPYRLYFKAWSQEPLPAQLLIGVGHVRLPFSAAAGARVPVTTEPQSFVVDFSSTNGDPSVGVAFLATGAPEAEPTRVCVSDMTLVER